MRKIQNSKQIIASIVVVVILVAGTALYRQNRPTIALEQKATAPSNQVLKPEAPAAPAETVTAPTFDKTNWKLYQDQSLGVQFQIPNNFTEESPGRFRAPSDKNISIDFYAGSSFSDRDDRVIINGITWSVYRSGSAPIWINYQLVVRDHEYPSINFSSSDEQLLQQVLSTFKITAKPPITVPDFDKTDWKLYQDKDLGVEFQIPNNLTNYSHGGFRTPEHETEYEQIVKNCANGKDPNGNPSPSYCIQETPHLNFDLTFGTFSIYSGRGDYSRTRVMINGVAWLKADFLSNQGKIKPQFNYQLEQRIDETQVFEFSAMDEQMLLKVLSTFKITSKPLIVDDGNWSWKGCASEKYHFSFACPRWDGTWTLLNEVTNVRDNATDYPSTNGRFQFVPTAYVEYGNAVDKRLTLKISIYPEKDAWSGYSTSALISGHSEISKINGYNALRITSAAYDLLGVRAALENPKGGVVDFYIKANPANESLENAILYRILNSFTFD